MRTRPIPILKFPLLVLTEIVHTIPPDELVTLSLCSRRMHVIIKSESRHFSKVKLSVAADFDDPYHLLSMKTLDGEFHFPLRALPITEFKSADRAEAVKIGGHVVLFVFPNPCDNDDIPKTYWEDPVLGFKKITEYVCNLFNLDIHELQIRRSNFWMMEWVQSRQKVLPATIVTEDEALNADEYQYVLSKSTSEHLMFLNVPPANFNPLDPFSSSAYLLIKHGGWVRVEHVQRMDCADILIKNSNMSRADLNIILKHWLADSGFQRLKCLQILQGRLAGRADAFRDLGSKLISVKEEKRANGRFFTIAANHLALKRSDGKIASVDLRNHSMGLYVWPDDAL